jgi:hypothetical protein
MKKLGICAAIILFAGVTFGQQVSEKTIRSLATSPGMMARLQATSAFQGEAVRLDTIVRYREAVGSPLYLVNYANGRCVVFSSDQRCQPVLAMFNGRVTDPSTLPPNVREFMDGYQKQLDEVDRVPDAAASSAWKDLNQSTVYSLTGAVAPLLKTQWHQGTYCNTACPADPRGPDGHVLAGCVAVALGQIMKYYRYPASGSASMQYTPATNPQYGQQYVDFSRSSYQWDAMPDTVTGYNAPLAKLLYDCGVAVVMDYGPDASGAVTGIAVPQAMATYFKYAMPRVLRMELTSAWEDSLKKFLNASSPILYSARSTSTGHAFVCDGYETVNGANYFHMNWGWGGAADGYFAISALHPGSLDLTLAHQAIVDFRPAPVTTAPASVSGFVGRVLPDFIDCWWNYVQGTVCVIEASPDINFRTFDSYIINHNNYAALYFHGTNLPLYYRVRMVNSAGVSPEYFNAASPPQFDSYMKRVAFLEANPSLRHSSQAYTAVRSYNGYLLASMYNCTGERYVLVFNRSRIPTDPDFPQRTYEDAAIGIGTTYNSYPYLEIHKNTLVVTGDQIRLFDLSALPDLPLIATIPGLTFNPPFFLNDLLISDDRVFDISNPHAPTLVTTLDHSVRWAETYGDTLITASDSLLRVMTISNGVVTPLGQIAHQMVPLSGTIRGKTVYLNGEAEESGIGHSYLKEIDITIASTPVLTKSTVLDYSTRSIVYTGDLAITSQQVVRFAGPQGPVTIGSLPGVRTINGYPFDGDIDSTFVYQAGQSFISVLRTKPAMLTGETIGNVRLPDAPALAQNFPNPFNPSTTIRYSLHTRGTIRLAVFNTLGQQVALLENGEREAGDHEVRFDGAGFASGVYYYRLEASGYVESRRLVLLK